MPRTDNYTGRLRVSGEISATNLVNFDYTSYTHYAGVRTLTQHAILTAADSGKLIVLNNATNMLKVTLPLANTCNGLRFTFYNATANGFQIIGDTNAISCQLGVNAADKIKIAYFNHTTNWGQGCDVWCDAATYYLLPRHTLPGNVGPGFQQG